MMVLCWAFMIPGIFFILNWLTSASTADLEEISVEAGQDVLLSCFSPRDSSIDMVEWQRRDIQMEDYVLFWRGNLIKSYQNPSYRGRVKMVEPQLKDGNVSIILSNTTMNDSGTYRCSVSVKGLSRQRRGPSVAVSTIRLNVTRSDPSKDEGRDGGPGVAAIVVSVLCILLAALIAAVLIYRKNKRTSLLHSDLPK